MSTSELTAPDGVEVWRFGPSDADSTITGAAGAFCRVGAQRLTPDASGLVTTGPHADGGPQSLEELRGRSQRIGKWGVAPDGLGGGKGALSSLSPAT